jgi:hypothetical protein
MKPDKIYLSLALLIILTTISWITSCTHKADLTGMYNPCWDEVSMIFNSSCVSFMSGSTLISCHDGQGESDLRLDTYENIINANAVVPYNPYSSPVYKTIIATMGENKMPPDQPLSLDNRTIIRLWIEQGAEKIPCLVTKGIGGNDPYLNQRAGVTSMAPAEPSLPVKSDNLKSGSVPAL